MAQCVMHDLDIHACFTHSGGEGMPQRVTTKVRKQYGVFFTLLEHLVVAVPDDPADSLVQRSLIKGSAVPVEEDEIRVAVNGHLAHKSYKLLILPLHKERFFYKPQHRHLPLASFRLGCVDIEVASGLVVLTPVVVVYQGVIDVNKRLSASDKAAPNTYTAGTTRGAAV